MMKKLFAILALLWAITSEAQVVVDTAMLSTNKLEFICPGCSVYPKVYQQKVNSLGHAGFKNPDDYGANGNDASPDDAAIKAAFNAAKTAKTGVIFTSGKTYYMSALFKMNLAPSDTIRVYAYGATIVASPLTVNSFFDFIWSNSTVGGGIIWLGGTIDGNQFNQYWPYNPHGGIYDTRAQANDNNNQGFAEAHACLLAAELAGFALFKDIKFVNSVLDCVRVEGCKLAVVADCTADNGAPVHYNTESQYSSTPGVSEQGSYFKFRTIPNAPAEQNAYFLSLRMIGGSIAIQFSYPDPRDGTTTMPHNTIGVIANCYAWNQAQDNYHVEDCYKNYFYNSVAGADAVGDYMPRVWVSNRTGVCSFVKCTFINSWINYVSAVELKLGMIKDCKFVSQYTAGNSKCAYFVSHATHITNSTFDGRVTSAQVTITPYISGCIFSNWTSKAVGTGANVVDNCSFIGGASPVGSGTTYRCTYTGVTGSIQTNAAVNSTYLNPFKSYCYLKDATNTLIGTITTGIF
jgi:hypothetical protein